MGSLLPLSEKIHILEARFSETIFQSRVHPSVGPGAHHSSFGHLRLTKNVALRKLSRLCEMSRSRGLVTQNVAVERNVGQSSRTET